MIPDRGYGSDYNESSEESGMHCPKMVRVSYQISENCATGSVTEDDGDEEGAPTHVCTVPSSLICILEVKRHRVSPKDNTSEYHGFIQ